MRRRPCTGARSGKRVTAAAELDSARLALALDDRMELGRLVDGSIRDGPVCACAAGAGGRRLVAQQRDGLQARTWGELRCLARIWRRRMGIRGSVALLQA